MPDIEGDPTKAMLDVMEEAIRDGAGPDVQLLLDLNFNCKTEGYLKILREIADFDMFWVEIDSYTPDALAYIRVPVAVIQGAADQYGTARQVEIIQSECYCPVEVTMLSGVGHSPHREAAEVTLKVIADFAGAVLPLAASI